MREQRITSRQNSQLQMMKKLLADGKLRRQEGLYAAEGTKLLEEAMKWSAGVTLAVLSDGVDCPDLPEDAAVLRVPGDVMASLSQQKSPQGALFACRLPAPQPWKAEPGCIVLDGIQDPGNLGTILRTADALQVPAVLLEGCADPYSAKVVRATMGAIFRSAPAQTTKEAFLAACREHGVPIAVTAMDDSARDIRTADLTKFAAVIGSEGQGVCRELMAGSDARLIIPMNPKCESLNAAVAAALVMWQMQRI